MTVLTNGPGLAMLEAIQQPGEARIAFLRRLARVHVPEPEREAAIIAAAGLGVLLGRQRVQAGGVVTIKTDRATITTPPRADPNGWRLGPCDPLALAFRPDEQDALVTAGAELAQLLVPWPATVTPIDPSEWIAAANADAAGWPLEDLPAIDNDCEKEIRVAVHYGIRDGAEVQAGFKIGPWTGTRPVHLHHAHRVLEAMRGEGALCAFATATGVAYIALPSVIG